MLNEVEKPHNPVADAESYQDGKHDEYIQNAPYGQHESFFVITPPVGQFDEQKAIRRIPKAIKGFTKQVARTCGLSEMIGGVHDFLAFVMHSLINFPARTAKRLLEGSVW